MKIRLITLQHKKTPWVQTASEIYSKRLRAYCQLQIQDLAPTKQRSNIPTAALQKADTAQILQHVKPHEYLVACDEHGKNYGSVELAQELRKLHDQAQPLTIIIGGADGLDQQQLTQLRASWSLSALTLPQHLARILLLEQLYRAFSLMHNHPYHRA